MLKKKDVDRILETMLRSHDGVSDLNFTPGKPLQVESSGSLEKVVMEPRLDILTPYQTEMLTLGILGGDRNNYEALVKQGSADCAYELGEACRFRVNAFQQRKQFSMVLRKLETEIKTLDELGIPAIFKTMAQEKNGLILVTGATGSGKSTTLAALLNEMNETRSIHILTIEDPIEYVHPHKKATFNQRELGTDFDTFHSSLRAALRQAPKVILIGEMRDRETVEIGLAAASTGHLVLSTLHSIDCGQTINRIVGMFDKEEEAQIRAKLTECTRFVVNQRLLPRLPKGRVASQEIMGMNLRVKELMLQGESEGKTFYDVIGVSRNRGWQTHDQCIVDHYEAGLVSEETALAYGSNRPVLSRLIDRIKQERGEEVKDALQLSLDTSGKEIDDLIKNTWPGAGKGFPIQADIGQDSRLIVYEPAVTIQGRDSTLIFPLKVQGAMPTVPLANPTGELHMAATTSGGNAPLVNHKRGKLGIMTIAGNSLVPKVEQQMKSLLDPLFPDDIQLPNTAFTPSKQEALAVLGQRGKLFHVKALEAISGKAIEQKEIDAVDEVIAKIKERGV